MIEKKQQEAVKYNVLSLKIATVNGSGSASANNIIGKAILRMGIPFSTKNLFPSNIQGSPTWFEIHINAQGFVGRKSQFDMMVAMNPQTYNKDIHEVRTGGYLLYDSSWPLEKGILRDDLNYLGIPISNLASQFFKVGRQLILMKNIVYVGAIAALLDFDIDIVNAMLKAAFKSKQALLEKNIQALLLGYDYAKQHLTAPLPQRVKAMNVLSDHILIDGNTALGLGCLYAGATVAAWYPITPSTSVMDAFETYCKRYRTDPESQQKDYCVIQAEDEISAVGIAIGACWNGARAFTATSGPGISLMNELIGLAYFTETPLVVIDVQRVGPSTGLPTRTQQGDLLSCAYASHGDTKHVLLFPSDPKECFEIAITAFDLADQLQTPVFIMTDLDIGMNQWVCPEIKWDDKYQHQRGKILTAEALEALTEYGRYTDVDGDGICSRLLPGASKKGAFLTRGTAHNGKAKRTEDPILYEQCIQRLAQKFETAKAYVPEPVIRKQQNATAAIVAIGSSDSIIEEVLAALLQTGKKHNYMRIKAFPFGQEVEDFLADQDRIFVIDQNRDSQLKALLTLETEVDKNKLIPIRQMNGLPISADHILEQIVAHQT